MDVNPINKLEPRLPTPTSVMPSNEAPCSESFQFQSKVTILTNMDYEKKPQDGYRKSVRCFQEAVFVTCTNSLGAERRICYSLNCSHRGEGAR